MSYLNLALVQIASPSNNPDIEKRKQENYEKMEYYLNTIANMNPAVDLIAFPELYLNGLDPENWYQTAESIPGPLTNKLCEKAKELKKWIAPGSMFEKAETEGEAYNTAILISPEGEIVMKYRKVFIPYPLEPSIPGDDFPVYEIPNIGKVGFMICADGHYPEAARNLALKGAEVIIKPTLQGDWIGGQRNNLPIAITRAVENQCFVVSINHPNPIGMGHSVAVDPEGRIIEELGDSESFTIVYLNLDEVRRVREYGSMGMFGFLKMLKEFKESGKPVDECYQIGIEAAPIYQTFETPNAKTPADIRKYAPQTQQKTFSV
ncbi:carbon-nitrogen hydrolase family protein [Lysinibacillus antri]|uniref:Carbon-nitrogen hydrolase family protein n=1 Tax=Lysinibacillus antri TaxID=2498145 RepID=A0A432LF83_9BACI|nr:carbon-nitrogen hydrolase family protein [Lysinibacillus antri]RUL54654.1 carbon-nitrogen hydrolase family protein [Lysinibacillus antri]